MDTEPSIWSRLYDFYWAVLPYWWLLVAGGVFALEPMMESLLKDSYREWLNTIWPKTARRGHFRIAAVAALFLSSFLAFDDMSAKFRHSQRDLHTALGERDEARKERDVSPAQQSTIDRLSGDLTAARGKIDEQQKLIDSQQAQIASQAAAIQKLEPKPNRHISDLQRQKLIEVFKPLVATFPTLEISAPADGEAQSYAHEFATIFNSIGIKVARIGFVIPTSVGGPGIQISVKDIQAPPHNALVFQQAMIAAGFQALGGMMDTLPDDQFVLVIASR